MSLTVFGLLALEHAFYMSYLSLSTIYYQLLLLQFSIYSLLLQFTKTLAPILTRITHSDYTAKTLTLLKRLPIFDHKLSMLSFNVESLFTNIRLNEKFNYCVKDLFASITYLGKLSQNDLYCLIEFVKSEGYFIFGKMLYKQAYSVAKGYPLGPLITNTLRHFEKRFSARLSPRILAYGVQTVC